MAGMARGVAFFKKEATYGSDPTPTSAEMLWVENLVVDPVPNFTEQNVLRGTYSREKSVSGSLLYNISFEALSRPAAAGTAPAEAPMLIGAALSESVTPSSSVTYTRLSNMELNPSGFTMWAHFLDASALIYKVSGIRGNLRCEMNSGAAMRFFFSGMGIYADPTDGAAPGEAPTDLTPAAVLGASCIYDSYSVMVSRLSIDLGNMVNPLSDMNQTYGFKSFRVNGGVPVGEFDPVLERVATYNWQNKMRTNNEASLTCQAASTTGTAKWTMPKTQITKCTPEMVDGVMRMRTSLKFNRNAVAGGDELTLVYS